MNEPESDAMHESWCDGTTGCGMRGCEAPPPHNCRPPCHAEDFDQWRCRTCGSWWMANEDDGWTRDTQGAAR